MNQLMIYFCCLYLIIKISKMTYHSGFSSEIYVKRFLVTTDPHLNKLPTFLHRKMDLLWILNNIESKTCLYFILGWFYTQSLLLDNRHSMLLSILFAMQILHKIHQFKFYIVAERDSQRRTFTNISSIHDF
jgi:hypothetical protein